MALRRLLLLDRQTTATMLHKNLPDILYRLLKIAGLFHITYHAQ